MSTATDISKRYYQKWSELTDEQKAKSGSKEEHSAAREQYGLKNVDVEEDTKTRMAGDAIKQIKSQDEPNQQALDTAKDTVYGQLDNIKDFDTAAAGSGADKNKEKLSKIDIKSLNEAGYSKQEIVDYADSLGDSVASGDKAQKLLNKYKSSITTTDPDPTDPAPTGPGPTPGPTPVPTPNPTPKPGPTNPGPPAITINQDVGGDKIVENTGDINISGNNEGTSNTGIIDKSVNSANAQVFADKFKSKPVVKDNVTIDNYTSPSTSSSINANIDQGIGGDKTAKDTGNIDIGGSNYGTANTGIIDYSVNIGSAGLGGPYGGFFNNMQNSANYNALNENQYQRSRSQMTGASRAAQASDMAQEQVGAADRVAGLNDAVNYGVDYWDNVSKKSQLGLFGDIWNMSAPVWKSPVDPAKIEADYDVDEEDN